MRRECAASFNSLTMLTFSKLRAWNLGVGLFQLVTGVILLVIVPYGNEGRTPWYTFFILVRSPVGPPGRRSRTQAHLAAPHVLWRDRRPLRLAVLGAWGARMAPPARAHAN